MFIDKHDHLDNIMASELKYAVVDREFKQRSSEWKQIL